MTVFLIMWALCLISLNLIPARGHLPGVWSSPAFGTFGNIGLFISGVTSYLALERSNHSKQRDGQRSTASDPADVLSRLINSEILKDPRFFQLIEAIQIMIDTHQITSQGFRELQDYCALLNGFMASRIKVVESRTTDQPLATDTLFRLFEAAAFPFTSPRADE